MAENNTPNDNGRDTRSSKRKKLENLQLKRLMKQEKENRELRKQLTTLLNAQRELERRLENSSKNEDAINQEILKNNASIDRLLRENQKYEKSLQNAQDKLDEEQSDFYRMALQDNNVELQRLKELNLELRQGNKLTEEHLEDINEALEDMPKTLKENFSNLLNAVKNISLMKSLDQSDEIDEMTKTNREIANSLGVSQDELNKALRANRKEDLETRKAILGMSENRAVYSNAIEAGITNADALLSKGVYDLFAYGEKFDWGVNSMDNLGTYGNEQFYKDYANTLAYIGSYKSTDALGNEKQFNNIEGLNQAVNELLPYMANLSDEERSSMTKDFAVAYATLDNAGYGDLVNKLPEMYQDMQTMDRMSFYDKYQGMGSLMYDAYERGNIKDFTDFGNVLLANKSSKHFRPFLEYMGLGDIADDLIKSNALNQVNFDAYTSKALSEDFSTALTDKVNAYDPKLFEETFNKYGTSMGLTVVDFLDDWNLDWSDIGSLAEGVDTLDDIFDLLKWFKRSSGSGGASATANLVGEVAGEVAGEVIGNHISGSMLKTFGSKAVEFGASALASIGGVTGIVAMAIPLILGAIGFSDAKKLQAEWEKKTPEEQEKYLDKKVKEYVDPLDSHRNTKQKSTSQFSAFTTVDDISGMHRNGLDEVPFDGYKAVLHSGEAVLPRKEAQAYRANPNILKHSEKDLEVFKKSAESMNRTEAFAQRSLSVLAKLKSKEVLGKAKESAQAIYDRLKASQQTSTDTGTNINPVNGGPSIIGDDFIGAYTVKHETGSAGLNGGGMVSSGKNDPKGGISYGIPQYSTKQGSAKSFRDWLVKNYPEYNQYLGGKTPGTAAFGQGWKDAFAKFGYEFSKIQLKYNYSTGYDKWVAGSLKDYGIDFNKNRAFQEVAYSMATQHGPAGYKKYLRGLSSNMSDTQFLTQLYQNRINRAAVPTTKRWKQELQEMLALVSQPALAYEQGTPYVPTDQIALLHKGEMVVPKDQNPMNSGKTISTSNDDIKEDLKTIIQVLQWGFEFMGKKYGEEKIVQQSTAARKLETLNDRYQNRKLGR